MRAKIAVVLLVVLLFVSPAPARAQEIEVLAPSEVEAVAVPEATAGNWMVVELRNRPAVMELPWISPLPDYPTLFSIWNQSDSYESKYLGDYGWVPKDAISCKLVGLGFPNHPKPELAGDYIDFVLTVEVPSSGWAEIGRIKVVDGSYSGSAWGYGEIKVPPVIIGWVQGRRVGVFVNSHLAGGIQTYPVNVFHAWKVTMTCQIPETRVFLPLVPKRSAHFTSGEPF